MEKNAELRRKFFRILLADLMLEPDLRLALVNAMIREAATKSDIAELERRITTLVTDLGNNVANITSTLSSKDDIKEVLARLDLMNRDVRDIGNTLKVVESIGERFSVVESKMDNVAEKMSSVEVTFSNVVSKIDDSLSKIGSTTEVIEERTSNLRAQVSRLTVMIYLILILVLLTLLAQLASMLKLIP